MNTTTALISGASHDSINQNQNPTPAESKDLGLGQQIQLNGSNHAAATRRTLRERVTLLEKEVTEKDLLIQELRNEIESLRSSQAEDLSKSKIISESHEPVSFQSFVRIPSNDLIVPEGVVKPTSQDLTNILDNLKPLQEEINTLSKEINELRDQAQRICKNISSGLSTVTILETALTKNDPELSKLCNKYLTIHPKIDKAIELLEETIRKATHKPIPEEHIKALSAKNYLPLDLIQANDNIFEGLLSTMRETLSLLCVDYKHMKTRYENATDHLNTIDNQLGLLKNNGSYVGSFFVSYQKKVRIYPTLPTYGKDVS